MKMIVVISYVKYGKYSSCFFIYNHEICQKMISDDHGGAAKLLCFEI